MTNVTITVTRDDTGAQLSSTTKSVAEGDVVELTVVLEDPELTASVSESSGN